jgi:hypothetical protein
LKIKPYKKDAGAPHQCLGAAEPYCVGIDWINRKKNTGSKEKCAACLLPMAVSGGSEIRGKATRNSSVGRTVKVI